MSPMMMMMSGFPFMLVFICLNVCEWLQGMNKILINFGTLPMTMATSRLANPSELFSWSPKRGMQINGIPAFTASTTLFRPQWEMNARTSDCPSP
jgi:hypothetical protein